MAQKTRNPNEILHLQVAPGATVIYRDHAFGDRGTLQVRAGDLHAVTGKYTEVDPAAVPEASQRPAA